MRVIHFYVYFAVIVSLHCIQVMLLSLVMVVHYTSSSYDRMAL